MDLKLDRTWFKSRFCCLDIWLWEHYAVFLSSTWFFYDIRTILSFREAVVKSMCSSPSAPSVCAQGAKSTLVHIHSEDSTLTIPFRQSDFTQNLYGKWEDGLTLHSSLCFILIFPKSSFSSLIPCQAWFVNLPRSLLKFFISPFWCRFI